MNADEVFPGLWQGGVPPEGEELRQAGFQLLVLCAVEHQPAAQKFPGLSVLKVPLADEPNLVSDQVLRRVVMPAARFVAGSVQDGQKVLVTCHAGINRSGLVTGLALQMLTKWSGKACVERIRTRRHEMALCNPQFHRVVLNAV